MSLLTTSPGGKPERPLNTGDIYRAAIAIIATLILFQLLWSARILVLTAFLVLPGFVNAHAHVGSSPPLRGIPEDLGAVGAGGSALFQVTSPLSDLLYSPEFADELALFAEWDALAMLRSGVTTIANETVAGLERYVELILRLGLRTYVSPMFPAGNRERGFLQGGRIVYGSAGGLAARDRQLASAACSVVSWARYSSARARACSSLASARSSPASLMRRARSSRSMSLTATADSASTVQPVGTMSAKPPKTT